MKHTAKKLFVVAVSLLLLTTTTVMAQSKGATEKSGESGSMEDLKKSLGILGQDLKNTASEAGEAVSQWWSESSTSLGEKATAATLQTKVGVVLETNKDNLTVVILGTDGKSLTLGVTGETHILIQDTVTGLQTPFTGGKITKFKNIKKGDWIHCAFSLKDLVQARLPNAASTTIPLKNIDILR